jgi:hypothetical protein
MNLKQGMAGILLPLGRRCPEGADEGAFTFSFAVAPHQLGQMTYGCIDECQLVAGCAGQP